MNFNDYTKPEFLDNLIQEIGYQDVEVKKKSSAFRDLRRWGGKLLKNVILLIMKITRVQIKVFENFVRDDKTIARKVLVDYINNPECKEALKPQHQKIIQIYERLAHLSRGKGTWADGIDRDLLFDAGPESEQDEDLHLLQLEEMILDDVFVPDVLEEQVFEKHAAPDRELLLDAAPESEQDEDLHLLQLEEIILEDVFVPDAPEEQVFGKQAAPQTEVVVDPRGQSYLFNRNNRLDPPSNRMLFHIQADEFGSSSELEGGQSTETVKYLHDFLKRTDNPPCPRELIDQLGKAVSIQGTGPYSKDAKTQVEKAQKKITEAFDAKKPLLVMGGWTGKPSGHAIYYEIIPKSDKEASFRLYNTGAGVSAHPSDIKGHKVKYSTYKEWQEIRREVLESPYFLEALYELKTYDKLPQSFSGTEYKEEDVYQGLREFLQPKGETAGPQFDVDAALLMTPQRSGVCAWKSLMAFMRTKMELNDYKRFKCDIKLQSLSDYVSAHRGNIDPADWRLVKKSHQNLSRAIVKLHQRKLVGDPYIQTAQKELKSISEWIHSNSSCRYTRPVGQIPTTYIPCAEDRIAENQHAFAHSLEEADTVASADAIGIQPCRHMLDDFQQIDTTHPTTIDQALEELLAQARDAWAEREDLALHKGLIDFVTTLEMDEAFWKEAVGGKPEVAEKLIAHFGEIAQLFMKSCFTVPEGHIIFSEKVYLLEKVLYLQERLCRIGHPKWNNLRLVRDLRGRGSLFLRFPNAKMHREMERIFSVKGESQPIRINDYCTVNNRKGISIAYLTGDEEGIGLVFEFAKSKFKSKWPNFEDFLRKQYPKLIAAIAKDEPGFKELSKFSQDAHIYASSTLPDWIKAMRDTQLASYHLKEVSVGPLASLDRNSDLVPQFQIEDKEEVSEVKISLTGVNSDILKVPEVANARMHKHLRYAGQYQEIASPAIRKFVDFICATDVTEKFLANLHAKEFGVDMANEEFKELARLFAKPELQHIETLEYFTKHPEKLQESDYQTLLHVLLFQAGLLDKNLAIQGFGDRLARFIQQNYERFSEENEIQSAIFLLRLAHQLHGFCPEQDFYGRTLDNLTALLERKGLDEDVKFLVYAELVAELGHKETLTEDEVALLVIGSVYIEENQLQSKYSADPSTRKEGREALLMHAKQMQEALEKGEPNQKLLNRILATLRPAAKREEKWVMKASDGPFPFFATEDGAHALYPLRSQLASQDAPALLPQNIRQNPLFRQLFPGIAQGSSLPNGVFTFRDAYGCETLVGLNGDNLVVEQKQQGDWVRYVPSTTFLFEVKDETNKTEIKSLLGSRYLAQQYTHWQALKPHTDGTSSIYAIDPKSGERQHFFVIRSVDLSEVQARSEKKVAAQIEALKKKNSDRFGHLQEYLFKMELKELKENGEISEAEVDPNNSYFEVKEVRNLAEDLRLGKPSSLFAAIEDPAYIHEWYDSAGNLKKVELPRFNLSFKPGAQNSSRLMCEQFPKYALNLTESVKKLGVHQHYILLEDAHKQRKLILPQQDLKAPDSKEVLLPRYELDRSLKRGDLESQHYYVFDVQKKDELFSKSREAGLYLAEMLAAAQEYKKAAHYLKNFGTKLSAYTSREAKILKDLARIDQITGDKSGNGTVLQLYADYLRFKNSLSHHQELPDEEVKVIREHYDRYINLYPNVTVFKLQPEEEVLLLKTFLSKSFEVLHFLRLKELDPLAAHKLKIPLSQDAGAVKGAPLDGFIVPKRFKGDHYDDILRSQVLLTRPHEEMNHSFLHFYELARTGKPEDRECLKASLPFVRTAEGGTYAGMANFFEAVLGNPGAFPAPLSESDYSDDEKQSEAICEWKNELQTTAEKLLVDRPVDQSVSQAREITIPKGFYLEEKRPVTVQGSLKLTLSPLPSFAEECKTCFRKDLLKGEKDIAGLSSLLDSCHSGDPVQNREADRLSADLETYQKQPSLSTYSITDEGPKSLRKILSKDRAHDKATLEALEKEILAQANKPPESEAMIAQRQLEKWGKLSKVITLEELVVNFARDDFGQLLQRNPALAEEDLAQLAEKVGRFLLHATRDQQRQRAEETLSRLEKCGPEERSDLVNQLAERVLATRMYDPLNCPAYLVFEYFSNITMRSSQVEKLETFLRRGKLNLVMEMIMGSGKSKVLLPLLGLLRADGETLSMLIVPQPLFESISQDTQTILQGFSQSLSALQFDRHTKFTTGRLEAIFDELKAIRQNRECLIMTSKSVQCLLIKFVEECSAHVRGGDRAKGFSDELKLMQKILSFLKEYGYPIIDEADTVLNILHEVSFSSGGNLPPKMEELDLLSEVYGLLYTDPALKAIARFESDLNANEKAPVLTEQLYAKQLQGPLAKALVDRLGKMKFESESLTKKMHQFIGALNGETSPHLMHYLCRDKKHIDSAQQFYDSLDEEIQDVIALAGEQISHLLPYTLTRICDEKYGVDDESGDPLAIPFSASKTPSIGSQFSNPHITMNYTFQNYMKKGVGRQMVESQIRLLQEKVMREIVASGGKLAIKETDAGKAFAKLKGGINMPLLNYKPADLEDLVKSINDRPEAKLFFVSHIILPQLQQFENKMSCNPQNLVAFFPKVDGFTGTLWNGVSMHHTLKPEPAIGTDAKTLTTLWENSRDNAVSITEGSPKEMLEQLQEKSVGFDMISDAGGYFKEGTNSEMAHQIADIQGKEVVFYNEHGEQTITEGSQEKPLSQTEKSFDQRLTFLDQSHTTGADVTQKLDAIGLVTIGRNMLLRDLLQSVWRLRGLDKSQRVRFLISEEVAGIIRQKLHLKADAAIQLDTILKFVIGNQASQQGRDNYKALREGFANITQKILLDVLLNEKLTPTAQMQAFVALQATWIKPAFFRSAELYGHLSSDMDGAKVVELDKKQCEGRIKELFVKLPWLEKIGITEDGCLKEIEQIVLNVKDSLPAQLQVPIKQIEDDQTVEVEREMKTETERETQLEVQEAVQEEKVVIHGVEAATIKVCDSFGEAIKIVKKRIGGSSSEIVAIERVEKNPIFPLSSYLETDPDLQSYASAFDGILMAINVLEWTDRKDGYKLLGSRRTDFHHLLVKDSKVTLLSQAEASAYRDSPDYYNLTLGFNDPNKKPSQDEQLKIVKLKFLNGECQFNPEELKLLKLWLKSQGSQKMQKLFLEQILKGYPKKAARYQDSPLQNLFAER